MKQTLGALVVAVLGGISTQAWAAPQLIQTATIYEKGSNHKKPIYQWKRYQEKQGEKTIYRTSFLSLDGKQDLVSEETVLDKGKLQHFTQDLKFSSDSGSIKVVDGKVHFSFTSQGETKTDQETLENNFVIGPTIVDYLHGNWTDLIEGKDVSVRLGVVDRKETVGFKFFKIDDSTVDSQKVLVVKMKPTSFVIAAIVDPLIFKFNRADKRLLEVVGRTPIKVKKGDKWDTLDAETVYDLPISR
ncbi:hypothetical protein K2X30_15245 [bacterium]|jgi:hypothetical protein|nr:hypothetical protein [bacterium]